MHTHTQMVNKHGCKPNGYTHARTKPPPPRILDPFRHFTSSPPTVTTEDGKLVHILTLWKKEVLENWCAWWLQKQINLHLRCNIFLSKWQMTHYLLNFKSVWLYFYSRTQNLVLFGNWKSLITECFHRMEKSSMIIFQNSSFCAPQKKKNSCRFGMTSGTFFGWIMPLIISPTSAHPCFWGLSWFLSDLPVSSVICTGNDFNLKKTCKNAFYQVPAACIEHTINGKTWSDSSVIKMYHRLCSKT